MFFLWVGKLIEKLCLEDKPLIAYKLSTGRFEAAFSRKLKKKIASKLGIYHVVGLVLCNLAADKLFEVEDEVVDLKALVHEAVLKAHCWKTTTVSKQSCIMLSMP